MVRTSDMMVYGMLAMVFLGVIYITTVHFFAPSVAEVPHDHPPLKETGGAASGIIAGNIAKVLASRPSLPSEPPISENMNYKNLYNVLADWNPDNPDVPAGFSETLHHFDYGNLAERAIAEKFRNAELPFKLFNVSEFSEVANLWTDNYLHDQLSTNLRGRSHVEKSKDNHFMYWNGRGRGRASYKPPTEIVDMDFDRWLKIAKAADEDRMNHTTEHYYFMSSCPAQDQGRTFISKDLKAFSTQKNNFFITNVVANKGIQCRFGMRGVIAESHYDSGRNMVAMLKGEKRYILNPPWACKHLGIIADKKHPSYRHSIIDWSDLQQAASRGFAKVDAIDTILRTGEVLYIPTYWFHYMVSLKYSIQCNSRSGLPPHKEGANHVNLCMRE